MTRQKTRHIVRIELPPDELSIVQEAVYELLREQFFRPFGHHHTATISRLQLNETMQAYIAVQLDRFTYETGEDITKPLDIKAHGKLMSCKIYEKDSHRMYHLDTIQMAHIDETFNLKLD
ncbi:MAG: hypothetical protein HUK20_13150 [Fibrobacter sp.]|nr:hypothetical protein [Fibrobacter sp.]